jgi:uncharacterized membrane protein YvbJ
LVYCTKCGTKNEDDATVCINCGALLHGATAEDRHEWRYRRRYDREYYRYHRRGGAIGALVFGVIIVLIGLGLILQITYGNPIDWNFLWAIIILLVGVWLVARALVWHRRYETRRQK